MKIILWADEALPDGTVALRRLLAKSVVAEPADANGELDVHVYLDGRELAKILTPYIGANLTSRERNMPAH